MLRLASLGLAASFLVSAAACISPDDSDPDADASPDGPDESLGDLGDGKSDSFGIVDRASTVTVGHYRRFTFTAPTGFRIAVTQPATATTATTATTDPSTRPSLTLSLKRPDATRATAAATAEPTLTGESGAPGTYTLTITNVGDTDASILLNVRPLAAFGALPDPNAALPPPVDWQPPAVSTWPASYPIFNNTGCSHDCTQADSTALQPRSVMIKMLVAAIHEVKPNGLVRVSNFNISASQGAKPVVDALLWAMHERHATVKVVMDQAQNLATSRTTQLATEGAQVRFLEGLRYQNGSGDDAIGIMHSKIVAVDDQIVFTGSNNFSSTGLVINEENSVVLRGPGNADRIRSFTCDVDVMFEAGVLPGAAQKTDAERNDTIRTLDACNGDNVWFPPTGVLATGNSITYTNVAAAIANAKRSIVLAPDMLAHPGIVSSLISRARAAKAANTPFSVKLVLDASDEALHNPAFGECLSAAATKYGLDMQVHYWPGTGAIFQLMHHKFMIVDADDPASAALYNGSANYSAKAMKWSFENVTRYTGAPYRALVDAFTARFAQLFTQGKTSAALATQDGITLPACPLSID